MAVALAPGATFPTESRRPAKPVGPTDSGVCVSGSVMRPIWPTKMGRHVLIGVEADKIATSPPDPRDGRNESREREKADHDVLDQHALANITDFSRAGSAKARAPATRENYRAGHSRFKRGGVMGSSRR